MEDAFGWTRVEHACERRVDILPQHGSRLWHSSPSRACLVYAVDSAAMRVSLRCVCPSRRAMSQERVGRRHAWERGTLRPRCDLAATSPGRAPHGCGSFCSGAARHRQTDDMAAMSFDALLDKIGHMKISERSKTTFREDYNALPDDVKPEAKHVFENETVLSAKLADSSVPVEMALNYMNGIFERAASNAAKARKKKRADAKAKAKEAERAAANEAEHAAMEEEGGEEEGGEVEGGEKQGEEP